MVVLQNGRILLAADEAIYYSNDNGESWFRGTTTVINPIIHSLARNSDGYVFAATQRGIFTTNNNGETWEEPDSTLHEKIITSLASNYPGMLYAGTYDMGRPLDYRTCY
jgi:photosystem II stability/assembly factor-like uncharacterized protein